MTQPKQLGGGETVYSCLQSLSQSIIEGRQGRNSDRVGTMRQELMWKPWRRATYGLAHYGLLGLLSYSPQDHLPRGCTVHSALSCPTSIKKIPYRLAYSPMEAFSQSSHFPDDFSLCQVEIKTSYHSCTLIALQNKELTTIVEYGEIAHLVKCLPCKENLS